MPGRVHCFVFCKSDGKEFGQLYTESYRDVSILAHHAALLDGEQRELRFQGGYLAFVFSVKDLNWKYSSKVAPLGSFKLALL